MIEKVKAMAAAYVAALGTPEEKVAAQNLIAEVEDDIMPIDGLVAFAHSEVAVEKFGAEGAKKFAAHADELKASGAKYCDCPACRVAAEILDNKDVLLA